MNTYHLEGVWNFKQNKFLFDASFIPMVRELWKIHETILEIWCWLFYQLIAQCTEYQEISVSSRENVLHFGACFLGGFYSVPASPHWCDALPPGRDAYSSMSFILWHKNLKGHSNFPISASQMQLKFPIKSNTLHKKPTPNSKINLLLVDTKETTTSI